MTTSLVLKAQNWVPVHFHVLVGQNLCCTGSLTVHSKKLPGALNLVLLLVDL